MLASGYHLPFEIFILDILSRPKPPQKLFLPCDSIPTPWCSILKQNDLKIKFILRYDFFYNYSRENLHFKRESLKCILPRLTQSDKLSVKEYIRQWAVEQVYLSCGPVAFWLPPESSFPFPSTLFQTDLLLDCERNNKIPHLRTGHHHTPPPPMATLLLLQFCS